MEKTLKTDGIKHFMLEQAGVLLRKVHGNPNAVTFSRAIFLFPY